MAFLTLTGLVYNVGMAAVPYFEGKLAQCLADILDGMRQAADMVALAGWYVAVVFIVQGSRADGAVRHASLSCGNDGGADDQSLVDTFFFVL